MEKDDLKIASTDTGGDKRKRELLEDKVEGVLMSTFVMNFPLTNLITLPVKKRYGNLLFKIWGS
jgi:hypothetical protein